jgi:hypothetical protein
MKEQSKISQKQLEFIEQLKELDKTGNKAEIILNLKKWSLVERTEHYGQWDGVEFTFTGYTNWKRSSLECGMSLEDFIEAIEEHPIEEMEAGHFYDLWCNEMSDGDTEYEDEEFTPELTEEQEDELRMSDLYWDSEISDSEYIFDAGSIWSVEVSGVLNVETGTIETITYETE